MKFRIYRASGNTLDDKPKKDFGPETYDYVEINDINDLVSLHDKYGDIMLVDEAGIFESEAEMALLIYDDYIE